MLSLDTGYLGDWIDCSELNKKADIIKDIHTHIHNGTGVGAEFLGWRDLPMNYDKQEYRRIKIAAKRIKQNSQVLLVIGAGGSFLGAKAAIEFLHTPLYNQLNTDGFEIYFVGHNLSTSYLSSVITILGDRDFSVNVISKSGTTSEPAIAFRFFRELAEKKYGKADAAKRIYCTTDKTHGAMKQLADTQGYETFVIPDNVGGRYSVLSPVGLLPIAVSGSDTDMLLAGAQYAAELYNDPNLETNPCYKYAVLRNILYTSGRSIELLVTHDPSLEQFSQWYRQLFAESEGKCNKGLFPVSASFTKDLHSIGQYIQQGTPNMFETVVWIENSTHDLLIGNCEDNLDGLDYLKGRSLNDIGCCAMKGAILAHLDGNIPNILIKLDKQDEFHLGILFYFFEKACAASAYMLGVNPFDQPGVEAYKTNLFALLGKPGYTDKADKLNSKFNYR